MGSSSVRATGVIADVHRLLARRAQASRRLGQTQTHHATTLSLIYFSICRECKDCSQIKTGNGLQFTLLSVGIGHSVDCNQPIQSNDG